LNQPVTDNSVRDQWLGRLQIALAAALWSTSGFFAKAPWFDAWPEESRGLLLAFWRSLFAIPILLPMIRKPVWNPLLVPMMACFAIMVWSFMTAMVKGPAANAIWLQYLCPAWVILASVVFFKQKISGPDLRMFSFSISGVALMLICEMVQGSGLYATFLGVLSGFSMAGVLIFMRKMNHVDPAWLITLNHAATVLLLTPWVWHAHQSIDLSGYLALAFFGTFQMSVPYILFARGLRSTPSPEASILALIEPILLPLWVFIAWHNHPTYSPPPWWTWVGGSLITIGLVTRYLPALIQSRNQTRSTPTRLDENR
jgi:drug/metabolite transporter, DME family